MNSEQLSLLLRVNGVLANTDFTLEDRLNETAASVLGLVETADFVGIHLLDHEADEFRASKYEAHRDPSSPIDIVESRSLINLFLTGHGRDVGMLNVLSLRPNLFTEDDRQVAELVAFSLRPALGEWVRQHEEEEKAGKEGVSAAPPPSGPLTLSTPPPASGRTPNPEIVHAMCSPLRLRLMADLLEVGEAGLSLEELVLRTGRHQQDVEACFRPLVRWRIVSVEAARYRLRGDMPPDVLATIRKEISTRSEQLGREHHVRHQLLGGMIGLDPKMQVVFELVRQVARIDVPVVIRGETGTGKELVARAIHDISPRRGGFFGAVNCATLKETLFESQMFGHMRGAFTGAVQDYVGLVERCHEGTLFLDEVGDLSLQNQVKLLRFLQEGVFTRLGDTDERRSDFRVIAATNRDLEGMVRARTFRDDLYYRLAVFPIRVPSLRERLGDLKYLVAGIMRVHAARFHRGAGVPTITPEGLEQLQRYHWPGNVRELENVILRALVMAGGNAIRPEHLPDVELMSDVPADSGIPPDIEDGDEIGTHRTLEEMQRHYIQTVLRRQRGNVRATAEILGISRNTLYKKIRDFSIDAPL